MKPVSVILILTLGTLMQYANMAYLDVVTFFDLQHNNLSSITWAHAVNNKSVLDETLKSHVMMLEADVVIGALTGTNTSDIPIMAHPPNKSSDLSLEMFLANVLTFNKNTNTTSKKKGVKLDFKSIEALEVSATIIRTYYDNMTYPVWINADIIKGPLNASDPVDATRFFTNAKQYKNSTLSVGWTTTSDKTNYTDNHVTAMLDAIKTNNVNQSITFPVRASIAAGSPKQIKTLLSNITGSTLTIWSSEGDPVNVTDLRELIKDVGLSKVFVDVPSDLSKQLNLQSIGAGCTMTPALKLLGVPLVALLLLI